MFRKAAVRISSVGGLVSAAAIIRSKQEENCACPSEVKSSLRPTSTFLRNVHNVNFDTGPVEIHENVSDIEENLEHVEVVEISEALKPNEQSRQQQKAEKLKAAISKARSLVWCKMYECGAPGLTIAVSVNGKTVWHHGFGYADLENHQLCATSSVMRIASISKTLTMTVLAKLWEEGKVDLEADVRDYVPEWPEKVVGGESVRMTVRQLCSHMAGVRHYTARGDEQEFDRQEYYLKDKFATTDASLALFKDDELISAPGREFHYSTHGYTLLAKVIENVAGEPFDKYMEKQFVALGLQNTFLDRAEPIIYNRARYYVRDDQHKLRNAPYVDNSYKWAGGGFLSNVGDLVRFGNAMLYSSQQKNVDNGSSKNKVESLPKGGSGVSAVVYQPGALSHVNSPVVQEREVRYLPGYLTSATMAELWSPQPGAGLRWGGHDLTYGLGWAVRRRLKTFGYCQDQSHYLAHTGGAIGASSVLLVAPQQVQDSAKLPQGVVVAVLCNLQDVGLNKLAADVAAIFQGLELDKPASVQKVYQC